MRGTFSTGCQMPAERIAAFEEWLAARWRRLFGRTLPRSWPRVGFGQWPQSDRAHRRSGPARCPEGGRRRAGAGCARDVGAPADRGRAPAARAESEGNMALSERARRIREEMRKRRPARWAFEERAKRWADPSFLGPRGSPTQVPPPRPTPRGVSRSRVRGLRHIRAGDLIHERRNCRRPPRQRQALEAMMVDVGFAGGCSRARQRPGPTSRLALVRETESRLRVPTRARMAPPPGGVAGDRRYSRKPFARIQASSNTLER